MDRALSDYTPTTEHIENVCVVVSRTPGREAVPAGPWVPGES